MIMTGQDRNRKRAMKTCFITQPVHPDAIRFLESNDIAVRYASAPDMSAVIAEIGAADAVITRDLGFSEAALEAAPCLRIVACHGSGTNRIAVQAASRRGIFVTRTPDANSRSVAELTIGLMLDAARHIRDFDCAVRAGNWAMRYVATGTELHGKILGLAGFGAIARHVAAIARQGLGMKVMAWSPSVPPALFQENDVAGVPDMDELLRRSDVVSLHRPASRSGQPLIDGRALGLMKSGAILINTSRGNAVDTLALADALRSGALGAAALDVLPEEPPFPEEPALAAPRLVLTPHIGAATNEALRRMAMLCAHQVLDGLTGRQPAHIVSE